jgi:hypothetical protein
MHENNATNINHQRGVQTMKNVILGIVLILALGVSACDTEGVVEPVNSGQDLQSVDKAILMQTAQINEVIGGAEAVGQIYLATGVIDYVMVEGPFAAGLCSGYSIHATMRGVISPMPNDQVLWSFDGSASLSVCLAGEPYQTSLICPLLNRNDGGVLRLYLSVTSSGIEVIGAAIEVPDATPVGS